MISSYLRSSWRLLLLCVLCVGAGRAQVLTMVSGNGQVVATQSVSNNPLVVQAKDASGHPLSNVAVSWSITQGQGTLTGATQTTDANGLASTNFLSTSLQLGVSFQPTTVTASSPFGIVNFVITTVISVALQPAVSIALTSPTLDNPTLTGAAGSTIPAGVVAQVIAAGGVQSGVPIANVGLQIVNAVDPSQPAGASCAGPTGIVLSNAQGIVTCDLVITGSPDTVQLRAWVGGVQYTRAFSLTITPGQSCSYTLASNSQSFSANGGTGAVNVATTPGCGWTASSNANFVVITSAASVTGSGSITYTVAPNSGTGRAGTLSVAGRTYTVNQAGGGGNPGSLTIPQQTLPTGALGVSYHASLTATGGTPPYTWSPVGPISTSGLALLVSGDINGAPAAAGTYTFVATVVDAAHASQAQSFSITINSNSPPSGEFAITNTSFPNGTVGQVYPSQLLGALGGCVTPFSPQPSFAVTKGALPDGLGLNTNSDGTHSITGTPSNPGTFSFTLTATDACGKTATSNFSITITGNAPTQLMQVNPASLAFTVQYGSASSPSDQTISISSNFSSLSFTAAVSSSAGGNWLIARSAAAGSTPGSFTVGVANFANLAPGDYAGSVTISSQASNSPVMIPVKLTVLPSAPLTVSPNTVTLNQTAGNTSAIRQDINLTSGDATVQFSAIATTSRGGQWLALTATQGSTPATLTAMINPGGLAAGQYTGTITIIPASGLAQTVTVSLNIVAAAALTASPAPLVFSFQQGGALPGTQTVLVNSSGSALNVSVSASTTGGGNWLAVSPTTGTTAMNVAVSVSPVGLSPGSYTGTITISANDSAVAPVTVPVTITITQASPTLTAVSNAASYAPGPVSPGEMVTIFGSGLGPSALAKLHVTSSGTVDTTLSGTQVFFDGYAAPLVYTSNVAVAAIVPYEIAGSATTSIVIQFQGARSNTMTVPVLDSLPGIFTLDASGFGQGAIVNQDGTVNSSQNGAEPGSIVSIYATGAGQTDPPGVDGLLANDVLPKPVLPVSVQIGGQTADLLYAGAAPGEPAGILQVNARIPSSVSRGTNVPVVITIGAVSSQAGVTLAIKQ